MIYLQNQIYVVGGKNVNEPCSNKTCRYDIKTKKWEEVANSNYPLRKPTLCTFNDRYIFKLGGFNEFDYISKGIEVYDPVSNAWSIVRVSSQSALEEV